MKSGKIINLCKKHKEEIEEKFATRIIEKHYYYPSPTVPYVPEPWQPMPMWQNPATICEGQF